ncbi:MAG: GNAT family N-acetyltransferase [Bacteroidota bacterium]
MPDPPFMYERVRSEHQFIACQTIRRVVFTEEQGIKAAEDHDGYDNSAIHVLVTLQSRMVGTGRVYQDEEGQGHIARIAVLKAFRGLGVGKRIVQELEKYARSAGMQSVYLNPHLHLLEFYGRMGYIAVPGSEHQVNEHQLIRMTKTFSE